MTSATRLHAAPAPAVCIAIHDVAPATWPQCRRLIELFDGMGAPPLTLLVVPDYHRRGGIGRDPAFVRAIDRRIAGGDEVALHGCVHLDESAPPRGLAATVRRRVLTAGEGEFSTLDVSEATRRIDVGLAAFARLGWHAHGFVAPAWLLGEGARAALRRSSLRYTTTHTGIERLADGRRIGAPCITASARSAWRRGGSALWLRLAPALLRGQPLLRLGLHPSDAHHAALMHAWRELGSRVLGEREALTKSAALLRHAVGDGRDGALPARSRARR